MSSRRGFAPNVAQPRIQTTPSSDSSHTFSPAQHPSLTRPTQARDRQATHTALSLGDTYATAPLIAYNAPAGPVDLGVNNWLHVPQDTNINSTTQQHRRPVLPNDSTFPADAAWQLAGSPQAYPVVQQSLAPRYSPGHLPPHVAGRRPPAIQITGDASQFIRHQEGQYPPQFRQYQQHQFLNNPYDNMAYEQPPHISDVPQQHVPVSPVSHHSAPSRGVSPLVESSGRKRSFSQLEQQPDHSQLEVNASLQVTAPNGLYAENSQPPQNFTRTVKRPDAPMNENHRYICNVAPECASLIFERKCEWSKHMDKHDRPYRCPYPQCAKLQGFTYSGGLLRHEREVHNKHGGPRTFLMCPHPNCKRHTEKGFTRRENLQEHLRRVHQGKEDPSQLDSADIAPGAELDTPASASAPSAGGSGNETNNDEIYATLALKRKRSIGDEGRTDLSLVDDLKGQVQRLMAGNEDKSIHINRLEEHARAQDDRIRELEQALRQTQQQHPTV